MGEPVVVTWTLYVTQQIGKFETISESRTDGFWSEDIPSTTPKGRLAWTQETLNGRPYQAARLYQREMPAADRLVPESAVDPSTR